MEKECSRSLIKVMLLIKASANEIIPLGVWSDSLPK